MTGTCLYCGRSIVLDPAGGWFDPAATGDDAIWRWSCDARDTFTAEHEPNTDEASKPTCPMCGDGITCRHDATPMTSLPVEEV